MTSVFYLNSDLFQGVAHTPLISINQQFNYTNKFLSGYKKIVLTGRLLRPTNCSTWEAYQAVQKVLLDRLTTNFGPLRVFETDPVTLVQTTLFECTRSIFRSISFNEDAYYNLVPFTIEFDCYDDFFLATGVRDASDETSYTENENRTISVTRTITATAVNTGANGTAIEYAKAFVESRVNNSSMNFPANGPLFANVTENNSVLVSIERNVDRMSGRYTATLTFLCDPYNASLSQGAVLAYSADISEQNDEISVTINGVMTGGLKTKVVDFRSIFNGINWFSKAQSYVSDTLASSPASFSVTEDHTANTINFNITYSNLVKDTVYLIDTVSISNDLQTNTECINVKVDIKADFDCFGKRWELVKNYYESFNFNDYIAQKWTQFGSGRRLGKTPKLKSVSFMEQAAMITITEEYCTDNAEDCGCVENFTYSINSSPGIEVYSETPSLEGEGCYYIQNLKYNKRSKFSISGQCRGSRCCTVEEVVSEIKSMVNFYCTIYFPADKKVLEEHTIDFKENGSDISFNFTWSGNQPNIVPIGLR